MIKVKHPVDKGHGSALLVTLSLTHSKIMSGKNFAGIMIIVIIIVIENHPGGSVIVIMIIVVIKGHHFQVGLRVSEEQGAEQDNTITGFHWPIHTVSHHHYHH